MLVQIGKSFFLFRACHTQILSKFVILFAEFEDILCDWTVNFHTGVRMNTDMLFFNDWG